MRRFTRRCGATAWMARRISRTPPTSPSPPLWLPWCGRAVARLLLQAHVRAFPHPGFPGHHRAMERANALTPGDSRPSTISRSSTKATSTAAVKPSHCGRSGHQSQRYRGISEDLRAAAKSNQRYREWPDPGFDVYIGLGAEATIDSEWSSAIAPGRPSTWW